MIFIAANFKLQSWSMIAGLFPPSSKRHGTRFLPAAWATSLPFYDEPVKTIISKRIEVKAIATLDYP